MELQCSVCVEFFWFLFVVARYLLMIICSWDLPNRARVAKRLDTLPYPFTK